MNKTQDLNTCLVRDSKSLSHPNIHSAIAEEVVVLRTIPLLLPPLDPAVMFPKHPLTLQQSRISLDGLFPRQADPAKLTDALTRIKHMI